MTGKPETIILFKTVFESMKMEDVLEDHNIDFRTISKPRSIGADCGVVLQVDFQDVSRIIALSGSEKCSIHGIYQRDGSDWILKDTTSNGS